MFETLSNEDVRKFMTRTSDVLEHTWMSRSRESTMRFSARANEEGSLRSNYSAGRRVLHIGEYTEKAMEMNPADAI